jgi:PucR-like helix-turn-helix protein/diguanylate cyclase with GGDEF domain
VPPALVEVADRHGFPVFAVPYETPFREIIHYVDSAGGDEHVFRRLTALQRYLVDALGTAQPERAMVERLARFLDASVVLLDGDGNPECVAGTPPAAALLREICAQPAGLLELTEDGWHVVATPIETRDEAERWLVLASPRRGFISKLAKPAAEATAPLLAALARLGDVVRDQEQAVKAALLAEALEPVAARDLPPLAARAAAFGIDFSQPARMVVVRGGGRELTARLEAERIPHLVQQREGSQVALVQDGGRDVWDAIVDAIPSVRIGLGRTICALSEAHHSLRDAELAVAQPGARIVRFEDFDLGTFMVSEVPPDRLAPKVDEILSVLRANPPLHEALRAYFEHDLDIASTAATLHMHRNSLRYRLARVEQVLGRSLKQPSTVAAVYIALVAEAADQAAT